MKYTNCCCGCGRFHGNREDFEIGKLVSQDQHIAAKYGQPFDAGAVLMPGKIYEIKDWSMVTSEGDPVVILKGIQGRIHHSWLQPERFLSLAKAAAKEHDAHS